MSIASICNQSNHSSQSNRSLGNPRDPRDPIAIYKKDGAVWEIFTHRGMIDGKRFDFSES